MTNKAAAPKVSGQVFQGISALLTADNIDPDAFFAQYELCPSIEATIDKLVPFAIFIDMLNQLKQQTSVHYPSLYLAKIQTKQSASPYLSLIASAPNIDVAMKIGERFRYAYSEVTYWNSYIVDDLAIIQRQSFVPLSANDREHSLYAMAFFYRIFKNVFGDRAKFKGVSLIQSKNATNNEIEIFFDCPVSFSQDFDGFILTVDDYYKPNSKFDSKTYQQLLQTLTEHIVYFPQTLEFSTILKNLIIQTLSIGDASLEQIAKAVGINVSGVKRRLKKEGLTFKELILDVRMNVAKRLLVQPDVPLTQISLMLGYSEASAFSRAFKAIHHCSPKVWRHNSSNKVSK